MSNQPYIYNSDIYLQFKELDKTSLRSVVHYFEKNKPLLDQLDIKEYFEVLVTYANAIFDLGQYAKFIRVSDEILFLSIDNNIYEFEGEDIYCSTLFRKSACHYNLDQKESSERILKEMIRLYPDNKYVVSFYKKILSRQKSFTRITRAIAVALILASASVIAGELLVVRPFYSDYTEITEIIRVSLLILGFSTFIVGEGIRYAGIEWNVHKELQAIKNREK